MLSFILSYIFGFIGCFFLAACLDEEEGSKFLIYLSITPGFNIVCTLIIIADIIIAVVCEIFSSISGSFIDRLYSLNKKLSKRIHK